MAQGPRFTTGMKARKDAALSRRMERRENGNQGVLLHTIPLARASIFGSSNTCGRPELATRTHSAYLHTHARHMLLPHIFTVLLVFFLVNNLY